MNIILATDDNYVQHCGVTIKSIVTFNKDVVFYLLTEGLAQDNIRRLEEIAVINGGSLKICKVPSEIVKYFPMSKVASDHISLATYYRLFITTLLPATVEKAIYLDCDMIIRSSLDDLWCTNIEGRPLGAVYQSLGWSDHNDSWGRLKIPREYGYFNAGCILLNLRYLREIDFQNKAISFINSNFKSIISHDQDVLNALFYDLALVLPCKWNYLSLFLNKNLKQKDFPSSCQYISELCASDFEPSIVHFVSKPKPWDFGCDNPYTKEYYYYLSGTPWAGYKPRFILNDYIKSIVIPVIKNAIRKIDILHISDKLYKKRASLGF